MVVGNACIGSGNNFASGPLHFVTLHQVSANFSCVTSLNGLPLIEPGSPLVLIIGTLYQIQYFLKIVRSNLYR